MAGLGLVHSLYRAHRAVVPATAWHLVKNVRIVSQATQLPEISTGKSRSPLTNIKHLAQKCGHKKLCSWELCVINAYIRSYVPVTPGSFEAKISIDIQQTSYFFMTFYDFLIRHFKKNVKRHVFWNLKKNIKYVGYSRTLGWLRYQTNRLCGGRLSIASLNTIDFLRLRGKITFWFSLFAFFTARCNLWGVQLLFTAKFLVRQ